MHLPRPRMLPTPRHVIHVFALSSILVSTTNAQLVSLEQALLEDMMPPSSCDGVPMDHTFVYPGLNDDSDWNPEYEQYEDDVFLARMKYVSPFDSDESWEMRLGKGGNVYSFFTRNESEAIPPQYHASAPWVDEVWQCVAVNGELNDPTDHPYFIHQAGTYYRDAELGGTDPFYSASIASYCDSVQCTFASWGQQAHIPTNFTSGALYYTRYRNCGNGTIEATYMVHNVEDEDSDPFDFFSYPWAGIRWTEYPDTLTASSGGLELEQRPPSYFGNIEQTRNTKGYIIYSEPLNTSDYGLAPFEMPCGANEYEVTCPTNPVPNEDQLQLKVDKYWSGESCRFSQGHTNTNGGQYTVHMKILNSVIIRNGRSFLNVRFTNKNKPENSIAVNHVHHWNWGGNTIYFLPARINATCDGQCHADVISELFTEGDEILVEWNDLPAEQARAVALVHGEAAQNSADAPHPEPYIKPSVRRHGMAGGVKRDFNVFENVVFANVNPGDTFFSRQHVLTGKFVGMESTADALVASGATMEGFYSGDVNNNAAHPAGRDVTLYSSDFTSFGAAVEGDQCGQGNAVCQGYTTPQGGSTYIKLFYIQCGNNSYVGEDIYHFAPQTSDVQRPYMCANEDPTVRAKWTLLGYFQNGSCSAIETNSIFEETYCTPSPSQIPSDSPSTYPSQIPSVAPSESSCFAGAFPAAPPGGDNKICPKTTEELPAATCTTETCTSCTKHGQCTSKLCTGPNSQSYFCAEESTCTRLLCRCSRKRECTGGPTCGGNTGLVCRQPLIGEEWECLRNSPDRYCLPAI